MNEGIQKRKILLLCGDMLGERMAGPGIRYWEFGRILSQSFDVTLVSPVEGMDQLSIEPDFPARVLGCRDMGEMREMATSSDVIVAQGTTLSFFPFLPDLGIPLVVDLYDPFMLEGLQRSINQPIKERIFSHEGLWRSLVHQIHAADFMLCASDKQRDYWLGMLSALGRINPYTHEADETLHGLIDVAPFGLPAEPPQHTQKVLKGAYPGIDPDDKVILWGGGIWDWFDAPTLIRAMGIVGQKRPDVKLFFMGIGRAAPHLPPMKAADQAIALSKELGLYDRSVFFNEWTPYNERQNYLLESDIGISLHLNHVETRFAFRSRLLDYLWAGLPIVTTAGDVTSDLVREWDLGQVVEPADVEGVAETLLEMLAVPDLRDKYQAQFAEVAASYRWEVVTAPLAEFCAAPRFAPDRSYLDTLSVLELGQPRWWVLPSKAWRAIRLWGIRDLWDKAGEYLGWILRWR